MGRGNGNGKGNNGGNGGPSKPTTIRCAIYTRKSTEEGLDQEFNSLDAQRESCESYIASQRHEGWREMPDRYDDGGFSGGTMERPALRRLLDDAQAGRFDMVVVYKVDRLSRSLLDFSRMIELFDNQGISFVSVTQSFNTNTSMGKLTLNLLLSFAQFEREIASERIRDKVAAMKRRGMYLGGVPPLGYDVDRDAKKLVVSETEARLVRRIFKRYLALGSATELARELNRDGHTTKEWVTKSGREIPGKPWNKSQVYRVLNNVHYLGDIPHKGEVYPGEHIAIIPRATWDAVKKMLASNTQSGASNPRTKTPAMLKGILKCGHCDTSMGATFARKNGKTYRYYLCLQARKSGYDACPVRTLPAGDIEALVVQQVRRVLQAPEIVGRVCRVAREAVDIDPTDEATAPITDAEVIDRLRDFEALWDELYPGEQARIVGLVVREAVVWDDHLEITFHDRGIASLAGEVTGSPDISPGETLTLSTPFSTRQYGGRKQIILPDGTSPVFPDNPPPDPRAVAIARAHAWMEAMEGGKFQSLTQLAQAVGVDEGYVRRQLLDMWEHPIPWQPHSPLPL
ncbi:MAG: recombinase family protein [Myxococcales bacterium]|nr:recombinase family protein [Myxococcales bacterium]